MPIWIEQAVAVPCPIAMFRIAVIFLFLVSIFDWTTPTGVQSRVMPLGHKPLVRDELYDILVWTYEQCIYVCIQNTACVSILYRYSGCRGYGHNETDGTETEMGDEAWQIVYERKLFRKTHALTHNRQAHIRL